MSWWGDLVTAIDSITLGAFNATTQTPGTINAQPPAAIEGPIKLTEGIWAALTDYKMWRSLGWLLLGVLLMILGALVLARTSAESVAGGIARGAL